MVLRCVVSRHKSTLCFETDGLVKHLAIDVARNPLVYKLRCRAPRPPRR